MRVPIAGYATFTATPHSPHSLLRKSQRSTGRRLLVPFLSPQEHPFSVELANDFGTTFDGRLDPIFWSY